MVGDSNVSTNKGFGPAMFMNTFQNNVRIWMLETFGEEIARHTEERCCRFLEESLELVQALDLPKEKAHALVEYVYGRPKGEKNQEAGGTLITLCALAFAADINLSKAADEENARCWRNQKKIREKAMAKSIKGEGLGHD